MPSDISESMRKFVAERANDICEYCRLPQSVTLHKHEPDHIIPILHGGKTEKRNLALACMRCNRYKGPNVASYDPITAMLVPLFNPRIQNWENHFELKAAIIQPITPEGRVTVKILHLNDEDRVVERLRLIAAGLYG